MSAVRSAPFKIGVSAFAWARHFDADRMEILAPLREHGLRGFEVPMFDPRTIDAPALRREIERWELECTVCAILPPDVNPISPDAAVRARAVEHLTQCIEKAAELGSRLLCGPLYAPIGYQQERRGTDQEWEWAVTCFQLLGEVLDDHQVDLAIEPVNRSETFFLRKASEAALLCERIDHPRVGVTLDTFHANIEEKTISGAVRDSGVRLRHIHASENDRGRLGSGHVDFRGLIAELLAAGYSGYLMIEGFGFSPGEQDSLAALLGIFDGSPEEIAYGGAEYLRKLIHEQRA
jgi:D-psicose/D-tagatose/L-ribulose 3-epimerase